MKSLIWRINQYQKERFPLLKNFIFILLYFFGFYNLSLFINEIHFSFTPVKIIGFFTIFLIFLQIRLFDEIKDYDVDNKFAPERPVQRGIISIKEIKIFSIFLTFILFILNLFLGIKDFFSFLLLQIFILLTLKEFFFGHILRKNRLFYASLHMLVMVFISNYIYLIACQFIRKNAIPIYFLSYLSGFIIEIGRKIESPENNKSGLDTYSKLLGYKMATIIYISIIFIFSLLSGFLLGKIYFIIIIFGFFIVFIKSLKFILSPDTKRRDVMEKYTHLFLIYVFILFIISGFRR
uniref:Prenyltransferase n=1 Tax=candidate division WOR-3 bacterium TaxID=2052148 RepID=A0A7C4UDA4_UNCW3